MIVYVHHETPPTIDNRKMILLFSNAVAVMIAAPLMPPFQISNHRQPSAR
jgi:hypothetical protein